MGNPEWIATWVGLCWFWNPKMLGKQRTRGPPYQLFRQTPIYPSWLFLMVVAWVGVTTLADVFRDVLPGGQIMNRLTMNGIPICEAVNVYLVNDRKTVMKSWFYLWLKLWFTAKLVQLGFFETSPDLQGAFVARLPRGFGNEDEQFNMSTYVNHVANMWGSYPLLI